MRIERRHQARQTPRCGMAPLEFVLLMPLLVGLCYLLFSLAKASLVGFEQIEAARLNSFASRATTLAGAPLLSPLPLEQGTVENHSQASIPLTSPWISRPVVVDSFSRTLAGTWDSKEIIFDRQRTHMQTHSRELATLANEAGVSSMIRQQQTLGGLLRLDRNPDVIRDSFLVPVLHAALLAHEPLLWATKPGLSPIKPFLKGLELLARASLQFNLARQFARWHRAVELGQLGCEQLRQARQGHRVDWEYFDPWDASL